MYKIQNRKDIDDIIDLYENKMFSTAKIGSIYNVSDATVSSLLKRNGIEVLRSRSRKKINYGYFKDIDSEDKAYFLGLIGADGCISKSRGKLTFSIELSSKDSYILEELSIKICGDKSLIKEYIRLNRNPTSKIAFSDSRFIKNLIDKGIFINKSLNYSFPDFIPKNLMHHYIRGYFDGDGSVYLAGKKSKFSFTGSHHFIPPLNKYLFDNNIFLREYAIVDRGNFCSIHIGGILPSKLFYEYIYSDANYYLNRKKDIFDSALCLSDKTNVSSKIGEGCDANTEVSLIEGKATVEHS